MKKVLFYSLVLLFNLISIQNFSQGRFSKWNFSYQYDANEIIRAESKAIKQADSIKIFLHLYINKNAKEYAYLTKQGMWNFGLRMADSYDNKNSEWSKNELVTPTKRIDNELFFTFNVPHSKNQSAYLFIGYLANEQIELVTDLCIKSFGEYQISSGYLVDQTTRMPVCKSYFRVKDSVFYMSQVGRLNKYSFAKYIFPQAQPPMALAAVFDAGLNLEFDTSYIPTKTYFVIPKKGNYAIGEGDKRVNFVAYENKFPKPSVIRELIDPIIYIASDGERSSLKQAASPKKKLDEFWLKLGIEKDKTRNLIKTYYNHVKEANIFFTKHKEGWKMDMGMIYIIFGTPNQVFRTDISETWYYAKIQNQGDPIRFVFVKKIGPFGDTYYELQNNQAYTSAWYTALELWRRGEISR